MKPVYYALLAVLLVHPSAEAQTQGLHAKGHHGPPTVLNGRTGEAPAWFRPDQRAAFWSEDFSGGDIPTGWTNMDAMTPSGQTPVTFQWSNNPTSVAAAAVNQPLILNFLAPGASNGYLWANSDRGLSSAPSSNHLTQLTTGAIDCSGQSTVLFTMRSTIGVWDNDASQYCKLRVSTDGDTWTDFSPFPCLTAGGDISPPCSRFSYNPQFVAIDITSIAANQPNVFLRLQWQGGWEYYWAIDDLELSSVPENELVLDFGYASQVDGGYEYGRIPQNQMPTSLAVGAQVVNFGSAPQSNVAVEISLFGPGGSLVASSINPMGTMLQGDTVMLDATLAIPGLALGTYSTRFTVLSDQSGLDEDPANNTKYRYFRVTEGTYSLDGIGVAPDSILVLSQTGTTSFVDNTVDVRFLTYFEVRSTETYSAIEVALGSNTQAGSYLLGELYLADDVWNGDLSSPWASTDIHVVEQADLDAGGVVQLEFFDTAELPPGGYYVAANLYQEGGNNIYVMDDLTVQQPNDASLLWISNDDNAVHLYSNGTAWSVRARQWQEPGNPDGIHELEGLEGVTLSPNPSTGQLRITLDSPGRASVEIFDMTGAVTYVSDFIGAKDLDLRSHGAGIYAVRTSLGGRYNVQRVVLQ